jgi:small subunit ribosomal protein S21
MQIIVRDNNVDQALRALKKKLQREGVYREMKLRRHYEKPSEKRAREHAAAVSRAQRHRRLCRARLIASAPNATADPRRMMPPPSGPGRTAVVRQPFATALARTGLC